VSSPSRTARAGAARLAIDDLRAARNGGPPASLADVQRRRILVAMARITCQTGLQSVTVARVIDDARVARRTFYDFFDDREDCLLAVFNDAIATADERVRSGVEESAPWANRLRGALQALLEFFDEEPELARVCFIHAMAGGRAVLNRRREVLFDLAHLVDGGRAVRRSTSELPPLTAEGVVGAVFSLIHARLLAPEQTRLTNLLNPLMAIVVLPYLGAGAAERELSRVPRDRQRLTPKRPRKSRDPLEGLQMRLTYRTICVLGAISQFPAASNREIADAAGIKDQGQISKLLARLEGLGLALNTGPGQAEGTANAWTLTVRGSTLARSLGIAGGRAQTPGS
jgi:AcrR family transcriptional regulator/DNA-binding MarR family transcriptional regulator